MPAPTLLGHLEERLALLTLFHDVSVNIVTSQPKRTNGLYPNLENPPKVWLEECLVTVSTEANDGEDVAAAGVEGIPKRKLLVAALEVYMYTIPATASTLIYISKVDSTGYPASLAQARTPAYTRALMKGFLSFHLAKDTAPTPRVFVHLFARSQNQYLFPNSIQGGAKRVAGGAKLCAWWKGLMEEVAVDVLRAKAGSQEQASAPTGAQDVSEAGLVTLTYILPSYEASEARGLLGVPRHNLPDGLKWQYLPPYNPSLQTPLLGMAKEASDQLSVTTLIPTFSDDPKARFLAELLEEGQPPKALRPASKGATVDETAQTVNPSKRQRSNHNASLQDIKRVKQEVQDEARAKHAKILAKISYDEFWERIGFRQECASGDVTGFFGISICRPVLPLQGLNGAAGPADPPAGPTPKACSVAPSVFARVVAALLNHDFGSRSLALSATEQFLSSTEKIIDAEAGPDAWKSGCSARILRNADARADVPVVTKAEAAPVRLLAIRKKPKPAPKPVS